jgi:hypothetical protein
METVQLTNDGTRRVARQVYPDPEDATGVWTRHQTPRNESDEGGDSMRRSNRDNQDPLRAVPDSLSLADLAHYVSGADDRRRAGDQVMSG